MRTLAFKTLLFPALLVGQELASQAAELGPPRPRQGTTSLRLGATRVRIGAVTRVHNSMPNNIRGIGIVTGLNATGSSDPATRQALVNLIRHENLSISNNAVASGGVALVTVNGVLPPFIKEGMAYDVRVSSVGDASSLFGGTLEWCILRSPIDGQIYGEAYGPVNAAGVGASGNNARASVNNPTTGWVKNGGTVVQELESSLISDSGDLELHLLQPSTYNASAIANGARKALADRGIDVIAVDSHLVRIRLPEKMQGGQMAMEIKNIVDGVIVSQEHPAKVIIDAARGILIAGGGIQISPCVIAVSDLTISVINEEEIVQPFPGISLGTSERIGRTRIEISQDSTAPAIIGGQLATVDDLLANLQSLSLGPRQLIDVFEALHQGGYLHGSLEVR